MEPLNIIELVKGGSTTVIAAIALILVHNAIKESKERRKEDTEQNKYHRDKIDKKDEYLKEITKEFTDVIRTDLRDVKGEMKRISEKLDRGNR